MKNRPLTFSIMALMVIVLAAAVLAQAPGQDAERPAGPGRGMPGQMRDTFRLMQLPRQITELNKDAKTALTPAQAKAILSVLKPLRQKPTLTVEEAKKVSAQLDKIFTAEQKEAMANLRPGFGRGMNRPGPGDEGRSSSDRPRGERRGDRPRGEFAQGQRDGDRPRGEFGRGQGNSDRPHMRWNTDAMKDFNPFYAKPASDGNDRFAEMRANRMNEFFAMLEKTAAPAQKAPAKKSTTKKKK
jgi:cell division septation protein DedD